jgi:hypothetical protein
MVSNAKTRAKRAGVPFAISPEDIVIPSHCPILGLALARRLGRKGGCDQSPSLDRIVPELGYVPGNIVVISRRANRIKNDATIEELAAIADFYAIGLATMKARNGKRARTMRNPA